MKPGSRSLGIAFCDAEERSRIAGAVVRADGILDGLAFGSCSVGGTDATQAVLDLFDRLDREDVQRIVCAGVAPAWYNIVDLGTIYAATGVPTIGVSFEESDGLEPALRKEFSGDALSTRLTTYRGLPERSRVVVDDDWEVFVRAVGLEAEMAADAVRRLTLEAGRPEPVRAARIAARAHHEAVSAASSQ